MTRKYGWVRDAHDPRDIFYTTRLSARPLPPIVDLESKFPAVYDQGDANSCVGNAVAAAFEYENLRQPEVKDFAPSRLFIYYNARAAEHDTAEDDGAQIRDGIKGVAKLGTCAETAWPYRLDRVTRRPTASCYADALRHTAVIYRRVTKTIDALRGCLADGFPVVCGIDVFESFESDAVARSGIVAMPEAGEALVGGHAIVLAGYDTREQRFKVRNSWGEAWGQRGYFTLPYAYVAQHAQDFWAIRAVR